MMEKCVFKSVWEALEDSPEQATNMRLRSELMMALHAQMEAWKTTQVKAAKRLRVTQPRLNDLRHGRIDTFSLDALVALAKHAGLDVRLTVRTGRSVFMRSGQLVGAILPAALLQCPPAAAFDMCDRSSDTIENLRRTMGADPAFERLADAPEYLSYADRAAHVIWNFTRPNSAAHPAVVCRAVVNDGAAINVRMQVVCGGPKTACDRMVADFQALNDQIIKDKQR